LLLESLGYTLRNERPARGEMSDIRFNFKSVNCWLVVAVAVAFWLRFSRLGDFDNQYYTATVASMLQSVGNFLFASFDPAGIVMVDKPPVSFWIQAIPGAIFGVSSWSVTLPQIVAGTLAVVILYFAIKPAFGRVAALSACFVLAVIPASVVIDSRNEPDSLLSLALLIAAFFIMRAVRTRGWRWLIAFALAMGIGFNIKMLVAFVPLPAFLIYYIVATRMPLPQVLVRAGVATLIVFFASISWLSLVALTPPEARPYVGSTQDDSIWTLALKYNGLDRFNSFIDPRRGSIPLIMRSAPPNQTGQSLNPRGSVEDRTGNQRFRQQQRLPIAPGAGRTLGQPVPAPEGLGYPLLGVGGQSVGPPSNVLNARGTGFLSLLSNPFAGQLGWLLPLGLFSLMAVLASLLSDQVYRHPAKLVVSIRESEPASQVILWGGWFATAVVVFGLASATTTHPYYLVGVAVPLAAILGISTAILWKCFQEGKVLAWVMPGALVGGVIYQIHNSNDSVGDWALALVSAIFMLAGLIMIVAVWKRLTSEPLAVGAVTAGFLSLLVIPMAVAITSGGRIAGPGLANIRPATAPPVEQRANDVEMITAFINKQGDSGSIVTVGTVNAREASPFIIAGVSAAAIGGFSGRDPVFSLDSFRSMVQRGELRYFLMPRERALGRQIGSSSHDRILEEIRLNWEDLSLAAGLPPGTIYRQGSVKSAFD